MRIGFLRSLKRKKLELTVILIGYVVTILVISMFIGSVEKDYFIYEHFNYGKESDRVGGEIYSSVVSSFDMELVDLIKDLGKEGEISIQRLEEERVKGVNKEEGATIIPIYFEKTSSWHPYLSTGRWLLKDDCILDQKNIVMGIKIAEKLNIQVGNEFEFYGEKYKVTGVVGKKNISTNVDNNIYIPIGALSKTYLTKIKNEVVTVERENKQLVLSFIYRVNKEKAEKILEQINSKYNQHLLFENYKDNTLQEDFSNMLVEGFIITTPLLIVSLVNIINILIYWIYNRKRELALKKALGGQDSWITKDIKIEMYVIAVISSIFAFMTQGLLLRYAEPFINQYNFTFYFSWINFIIGVLISLGIGYFATLIPIEKVLEIKPVDAITLR